jgi:hypothetical protein
MMEERAAQAILEIDGWSWRRVAPSDAPALDGLAAISGHRTLFGLPESPGAFWTYVDSHQFRMGMLCTQGVAAVGAAGLSHRNNRSLNMRLVCFFADPTVAMLPLAAYVRHFFWAMPMHRLYVQLPLIDGAEQYTRLLTSIGFAEEGVVRGYGLVDGRPRDVVALGLLRNEFEEWCRTNEGRLSL